MTDFKGFIVEKPDLSETDLGAGKITTWTDDPVSDNTYLRLWVGNQELSGSEIDQTGMVIEGFVDEVPAATDTLQYQYPGEDRTDTGLTAETEPSIT